MGRRPGRRGVNANVCHCAGHHLVQGQWVSSASQGWLSNANLCTLGRSLWKREGKRMYPLQSLLLLVRVSSHSESSSPQLGGCSWWAPSQCHSANGKAPRGQLEDYSAVLRAGAVGLDPICSLSWCIGWWGAVVKGRTKMLERHFIQVGTSLPLINLLTSGVQVSLLC